MSIFMEFTNSEPNKPLGPGSGITIRSIRHSPLADATTILRTLPGAAMAHPGLPIRRVLNTGVHGEQIGMLLPAGTIVTLDPIKTSDIYLGKDVAGTAFKIDRDHFYGYDETVIGWVRNAAYTTSADVDFTATAYDVSFNRVLWTAGTDLVADTTKTLVITSDSAAGVEEYSKRPIGILLRDLYFDPAGMYRAYELPFIKGEAIATTCFITIPYVKADADYKVAVTGDGYKSVLGLYAFLVIPDDSNAYINGALVKPDIYGNYETTTNPVTHTIGADGGDPDSYWTTELYHMANLDLDITAYYYNSGDVELTAGELNALYANGFPIINKASSSATQPYKYVLTFPQVINNGQLSVHGVETHDIKYNIDGNTAFIVASDAQASIGRFDFYGSQSNVAMALNNVVLYDPITVGSIVSLDNRMPRQLLNGVQVDPQFALTGTSTGGIYGYLFDFVKKIIVASGVKASPTVEDIQGYIQSGDFGLATINVNI